MPEVAPPRLHAIAHGPAGLYARLHRGNPGDLEFYRRACADARSILELGCGHGRILRALASPTVDLVGVDRDPALLDLARRGLAKIRPGAASLDLLLADFQTLTLGRTFDRVLMPYCGLYCLADAAAIRETLSRAAAHLAPGGQLLCDAYHIDPTHDELLEIAAATGQPIVDPETEVAELRWQGVDYVVSERASWWPFDQVVVITYTHRPITGGPPITAAIRHRYLLARDLRGIFATAGLHLQALAGGFVGEPLDPEATHWVARAVAGPES